MLDGKRQTKLRRRECLITTGATAPFTELVRGALSEECLFEFKAQGFTHITIQMGDSLEYFTKKLKPMINPGAIEINAFAFNSSGLNKEMRALQAKSGDSEEDDRQLGLVISHAGRLSRVPRYLQY
jgi:beta-1,4-N-acetylglucosaminyltransferase